jgi:hypothetical protein
MDRSKKNEQIAVKAVQLCGQDAYNCAKFINQTHFAEVIASMSNNYDTGNEDAKSDTFAICLNGVWLIVRTRDAVEYDWVRTARTF